MILWKFDTTLDQDGVRMASTFRHDDTRPHVMPAVRFPAVCLSALTRGCGHVQCTALILLSRLRCSHCQGTVEAGETYFVTQRDQDRHPEIIVHTLCELRCRV